MQSIVKLITKPDFYFLEGREASISYAKDVSEVFNNLFNQFFNAVSQSLGHSDVKTTFQSYGSLTPTAIGTIIKNTNDLF